MPTVHNGVGTWYYGKRRIHRHKDSCGFCNSIGELESYDTTLFFVVFFVPLFSLGQKRILEQCPRCQRHRVMRLKDWEAAKDRSLEELLEKLRANPDDRDAILSGLGLAMFYQDEALLDKLAVALAEHRRDDVDIQTQLGAAYGYFARRDEAETAYRAALAVEDRSDIREQLALTLLKQGRPDEAAPYLDHVLAESIQAQAGMIFLLVEGYQAQGMHEEALALMDRRDAVFTDLAKLSEYKKQRKTSQKYLSSGKRITSAYLSESGKVGYREGNWTAKLPKIIGPLVVLGLFAWYLGAAIWIGQARKVHLVNGGPRAYVVTINSKEQTLQPGVTTARLPEGEVTVEFHDGGAGLEPIHCQVESGFWSRPFVSRTFVINPDRLAVIVWEKTEYSANPRPDNTPPRLYVGAAFLPFEGIDYAFTPFPQTIQVKQGRTVTKTGLALAPPLSALERINLAEHQLQGDGAVEYAKRWLHFEPDNQVMLGWLFNKLPGDEMLAFLKPRLAARPLLIEWHRAYQNVSEKTHPEHDLLPEYRQLVVEMKEQPDAVYLLSRLEDGEASDKLLRQATAANPPSAHAQSSLGYHALVQGKFDEAADWMEKAFALLANSASLRHFYYEALLAAKRYDRLLELTAARRQAPEEAFPAFDLRVRAYHGKGDVARARAAIDEAAQTYPTQQDAGLREVLRRGLEMTLCCCDYDTAGYIKKAAEAPGERGCPTLLLEGKLRPAADHIVHGQDEATINQHALVYLAAAKAGEKALADEQWQALLAELGKGGRELRQLGAILSGRQKPDVGILRQLRVEPRIKRVLLAVAARRFPEYGKELLDLARVLDFHRDAYSLCLRTVLE